MNLMIRDKIREAVTALPGLNWCSLKLILGNRAEFRAYQSEVLRLYDEHAGLGLPSKDPVEYLVNERSLRIDPQDRAILPPQGDQGARGAADLLTLAAVTRVLRPKRVFEIGTCDGRTASVFLMNAPAEATVLSLDLPHDFHPPDGAEVEGMVYLDLELTQRRDLAKYVRAYHLEHRFRQILCDSLEFDPEPYRGSVDLGFIDGAHGYRFVKNDTEKMAVMMSEDGLVFWHDYGGKGRFRPLARYLEDLGRKAGIFRVSGTILAWATAADLRRALREGAAR
jgi:predicted O-methyltransferase YrrM